MSTETQFPNKHLAVTANCHQPLQYCSHCKDETDSMCKVISLHSPPFSCTAYCPWCIVQSVSSVCLLQVDVLSGGEKARLALAKFMLTQGTFLVLDEPTNHLDIPSKEMLEEALVKFEGSVIAVSHDRYFLRKIATRVVTVMPQESFEI